MARTTYVGYLRQKGTKGATPAVSSLAIKASFDPTSASQVLLGTLPNGAVPLSVQTLGGATGGSSPTVDIGTVGDDDGLANELDADTLGAPVVTGALLGVELTADTPIYGKVGASAATGGATVVVVNFLMADDGAA